MSFIAKRTHEAGHKYASCGNTSGYWLWRHATGNSLQFGIGKSNIFSEFENALAA